MSIYADLILDHYQHPRNNKALENPTSMVDVSNPLCGDKLHFEIIEKDGTIEEIAFTGVGCAISTASASMLSEYAKGKNISELKTLSTENVIGLLGIELSPNRMKCALLAWEGLLKLFRI